MSDIAIRIEEVSKMYRLGAVGSGSLVQDVNSMIARVRGKEDPYQKIGQTNDRSSKGDSDYVWSLKDISFDVRKGDAVGIIGKNGAGKSTLLKILSRVTAPTTGSIKIKGRIASLLEVGTGFHPELSGRDNIYMNGAIFGMDRREIRSKLDEIIDFSGCERYIDTPVKRYSSGMYVRLAFAVAAHLDPEILIVDEVLAVGDAEFQKKCLGKMRDVNNKEGRTVLFVSHNMGAVAELCRSGIVLSNGHLKFAGTNSDAIAFYSRIDANQTTNDYIADEQKSQLKQNYISFVKIKGEHGNSQSEFLFDNKIILQIGLKNNEKKIDTTISIALLNKKLNRVFTIQKQISLNSNFCTLEIALPSSLIAPNLYSFNIVSYIHNKIVFDSIDNICPIKIIDNGTELASAEGLDYGDIIVGSEWKVTI